MATSSTFTYWKNVTLASIIDEAYERIGKRVSEIAGEDADSAIRSMNYLLLDWAGRGLNLWMVQREMVGLVPGQITYNLPEYTVRVLEVVATAPQRINFGGTAFETGTVSSGAAQNCFTTLPSGGCTFSTPGASIGYDFGTVQTPSICYVGVLPKSYGLYSLDIEYSFDNQKWVTAYTAPPTEVYATQISWFVLQNSLNARYWRIRERSQALLDLNQVYFSVMPNQNGGSVESMIWALSREEWESIPNKLQTMSFPGSYYFNQTIRPSLNLYPAPSAEYTALMYSNYRVCEDVVKLKDNVAIQNAFYDALAAGCAHRLAVKFKPEREASLEALAEKAFALAANTNFENVPIQFVPNIGG